MDDGDTKDGQVEGRKCVVGAQTLSKQSGTLAAED